MSRNPGVSGEAENRYPFMEKLDLRKIKNQGLMIVT
jgi:hypothetical protein